MKTQIITIFGALVLSAGIAATSYATPANNSNVTVLNDITSISQIEVRGNVELYISNGTTNQVKVYNKYYAENALVQGKNGVLRITSYNPEKLVVWVSAADLRSVSAYDNSEVNSFGSFSSIEFSVDLHNNASAKLSLDAFNANVTVADRATATLTGYAEKFNLTYTRLANVNYTGFQSAHAFAVQSGSAALLVKPTNDDFADL